ncbi:MAG: GxxExxY protein [Planctomycetota bacterium]|nr:MAG: GxxExxY protein [Planctomycetota bacterium]REK27288.1 MAG: GxxExxY protein [Planctomycetota bacterium]REK36691.1 MAG: GxxExxY protein [Planctomycetota bacterium]
MHPLFNKADELSHPVIGAAIEVHRTLGPGLMEGIYEKCLAHELTLRGLGVVSQQQVDIHYKNISFSEILRCDLLVENCLLVELKCVQQIVPVHKAQVLTYMKLLNAPLGLLLNFYTEKLTDGLQRLLLPGANRSE